MALALVATIAPKLAVEARAAQIDLGRLNVDLRHRLEERGFHTGIAHFMPEEAVLAQSPSCRLLVRNGDRARELARLFDLQAAGIGPVYIVYRGERRRYPVLGRALIERGAQDSMARVGVRLTRPAVLAVATHGDCGDIIALFAGIPAHASRHEFQRRH